MITPTAATSELYWLSAVLLSIVDLSAIFCLIQCIPAARFHSARFDIPFVAFIFWGGLWAALMANDFLWKWCYCFLFTDRERWLLPAGTALVFAALGYGMWSVSHRLPWHPVVSFAVLGGLLALPDLYYAIAVKQVLDTPLLSGVSTASAVAFGVFEFVFYWILVLSISISGRVILETWSRARTSALNHS